MAATRRRVVAIRAVHWCVKWPKHRTFGSYMVCIRHDLANAAMVASTAACRCMDASICTLTQFAPMPRVAQRGGRGGGDEDEVRDFYAKGEEGVLVQIIVAIIAIITFPLYSKNTCKWRITTLMDFNACNFYIKNDETKMCY